MSRHSFGSRIRAFALFIFALQFAPTWAAPPKDKPPVGSSAVEPVADSPAALRAELQQLKSSLETESRQIEERSKELESERTALADQLNRIAALEAKLGFAEVADGGLMDPPSDFPPPQIHALVATPSPPGPQSIAAAQTPQDLSNRIANVEQRVKTFGPFTFSGDIRLREENFLGGPSNGSLDQNRERFRLRFNVAAKLNEDFSGGFSLASGDLNNPVSDNQNITGFYTRKSIAIDTAFIRYSPHKFRQLTLLTGKFAYPWYNTELVWDKDLNPEGAAETLAFDLRSVPMLKKIAVVGFQLPLSQAAGMSTEKSLRQNVVYGGQLQSEWQLASWLQLGAFSGFYDYTNADPIALALQTALSKNPQTPLTGLLPLFGTTVENSVVTTTATNVVTIGGTAYPTGVTKVVNAQFGSKFGLFDSLARFEVKTPWERWPVRLIGDYVQNVEACANLFNQQRPPANTASIQYSQSTNFACNSRQRRGYWGEIQFGEAKQRGDWEFDYVRLFIEREAVMSAFNYSEIYQGSNVSEHRAEIIYQAHRNVQLSYTALIGRPLNFGDITPPAAWLERMQFDLLYSF